MSTCTLCCYRDRENGKHTGLAEKNKKKSTAMSWGEGETVKGLFGSKHFSLPVPDTIFINSLTKVLILITPILIILKG